MEDNSFKRKEQHSTSRSLAKELADELVRARSMLDAAVDGGTSSWRTVLDHANFWQIRHDSNGLYSVSNMNSVEIEQSLVEDLLFVHVEKSRGSHAQYPNDQPFKHLGTLGRDRITRRKLERAVEHLAQTGMICKENSGLYIPPNSLEKAQEFSGYFILSSQEYEGSSDFIDSTMKVGGKELLSDTLFDILEDLDRLDQAPKVSKP